MDSERKRELIETLESFIKTPPLRFDQSWNVLAQQYIDQFKEKGEINITQIELIFETFLNSKPGIVNYRRMDGDKDETLLTLLEKRAEFLPSLIKEAKGVDFALKRRNSKIRSFIDQAETLKRKPDHNKLKDLIDNIDKEFPEFLEAFSEQSQQKAIDARKSSATSSPRSGTESSASSTTTSPRSVTPSPREVDPKEIKVIQDDLLKLRKVLLSLLAEEYQPKPDASKKEIHQQSKLLKILQEKASSLLKEMDLLFREENNPENAVKIRFLRDQIFVHFSDFILRSLQEQCQIFCKQISFPQKEKEESAKIQYQDLSGQIAFYVSQVTLNDKNDDLVIMAMSLQKDITLAYEAMNNKFTTTSQSNASSLAADHVVRTASQEPRGKFKKPNKAPPAAAPRSPQPVVKRGADPVVSGVVPQEPVDPPLPKRVPPKRPGDSAKTAGTLSPSKQPSRIGPLPANAPPTKTAGAKYPGKNPGGRALPARAPSTPLNANQPTRPKLSLKESMDAANEIIQSNEAKERVSRMERLGGVSQSKRTRERLVDAIKNARDLESIVNAAADYILRSDHLSQEEISRDQDVVPPKIREAVKNILGRDDLHLVNRLLSHVDGEVLDRRYNEVQEIAMKLLKSTDASRLDHSSLRFSHQHKPQHAELVNAAVLYVNKSINRDVALNEVKSILLEAAEESVNKERLVPRIMKDIENALARNLEQNRLNKK